MPPAVRWSRPDRPIRGRGVNHGHPCIARQRRADRIVLATCSREALTKATAEGWTCVIVTNGRTAQQEAKIRNTGLDQLVHAWVVSQDVGYSKPEPEIFQTAADIVGGQLSQARVVGDSPHADIAGAHALGLRRVWVSDGRRRPQDAHQPTHVAEDVATAINQAISADTACTQAARYRSATSNSPMAASLRRRFGPCSASLRSARVEATRPNEARGDPAWDEPLTL